VQGVRDQGHRALWGDDPDEIMLEFLDSGFKTVIVSCRSDVMGKEFIGRYLDKKLIKDLKNKGICPCGEKGEFHTLVVDGPIFKKRLEIIDSQVIKKESFRTHWFMDIRNYCAVDKN